MIKTSKTNLSSGQASSGSKHATSMAELLATVKTPLVSLAKGSMVEGTIIKLDSSEILVDIGSKTQAVVLEKDKKILSLILYNLKLGDKVTVSILNPESDNGNSVVSLRRYISDLIWSKLDEKKKSGEGLKAVISGETRGGFLVEAKEGVSGFLPNSQAKPNNKLGDKLEIFVLDLNRSEHRVIFSERPVIDSKEFERLSSKLKVGVKVKATITNIASFGIFATIDVDGKSVDGFIHISEISWDKINNIEDQFNIGDTIDAIIIGFDNNTRRVNLSLKILTDDPFERLVKEKFPLDARLRAKVSRVVSSGIIFELDGLEGMIKIESVPIGTSYKVGDEVEVVISKIDKKKRRILLTPVLLEKPMGYR